MIKDDLRSEDSIDRVDHNTSAERLCVEYETSAFGHEITDTEIEYIRQGKLTPIFTGDTFTYYEYHITLDEQASNRSRFDLNG